MRGFRQATANVRDPSVKVCEKLLATCSSIRIKLLRILAQRPHALTDGTSGHAILAHDLVHARLDRLHLFEPELMDLTR